MPFVLAEETLPEDSKQTEQPSKQWHLEDDTHHEDEHREVVDVALQIDLVRDVWTQVIFDKEPEGEWKDKHIADGTADVEHKCAAQEGRPQMLDHIFEECRLDEITYLLYKIG